MKEDEKKMNEKRNPRPRCPSCEHLRSLSEALCTRFPEWKKIERHEYHYCGEHTDFEEWLEEIKTAEAMQQHAEELELIKEEVLTCRSCGEIVQSKSLGGAIEFQCTNPRCQYCECPERVPALPGEGEFEIASTLDWIRVPIKKG